MVLKNPWLAILASAFILPGLGHVLIGRTTKGVVMVLGIGLYIPILIAYLGLRFYSYLEQMKDNADLALQLAGKPMQSDQFVEVFSQYLLSSLWVFLPLVILWAYALSDLIIIIRRNKMIEG